MTRRNGLTLIELLVVLTILVALSGVALRSTIGLEEQARFEATQRTLEEVRDVLVPAPGARSSDGSLAVSGFVSDVGRFPLADASLGASELWLQGTLPGFGLHRHPQDPEVALFFGWRGPYLRLPVGAAPTDPLRDGFGSALRAIDANQAYVAAGAELHGLRSFGSDRIEGGAGYAQDVDAFVVPPTAGASVTVTVTTTGAAAPGSVVRLRVFAPNPAAAAPLPLTPLLTPGGPEDVWTPSTAGGDSFTWDVPFDHFAEQDLTAGVRVLRAYYDADGSGLDLANDVASQVLKVSLVPGANGVYQLTVAP